MPATQTEREPTTSRAAVLFRALSDETRLAILHALRDGERCVCELQVELDAAQSRLSFHLRVLKEAGILLDRTEGRWSYYKIAPDALKEIHDQVVAFQPPRRSGRSLPTSCCG
jgi:ArsR family transcriptional regulator